MASHRSKEGYVRVCTEIPKEINDIFIEYEKRTARHINKSIVMKNALLDECEKVKKELEEM